MKIRNIILVIEEYRRAYWAHRDLKTTLQKRYNPIVVYRSTQNTKFIVHINDSWVEIPRPGTFLVVQEKIEETIFASSNLQDALIKLLNHVRFQFVNDEAFAKITSNV